MTHQTTVRSRWLPLSGIVVTLLGLVIVSIMVLSAAPVQARAQGPEEPLTTTGLASPDAQATVALSITVEATSTVVVPGQIVTYTIELAREGGTSPWLGQLINPFASWPGPLGAPVILPHMDGVLVMASGTVNPTAVRAVYGITGSGFSGLRWQGSLGVDSGLRIRYAAEVKPCFDPNLATIRSTVAVQGDGGGSLTDSADIQVDCLPAVNPDNVSVSFSSGPVFPAAWETSGMVVPGTKAYYQIELTNSDPSPTTLGLVGIFPSRSFNIGMPPTLHRTATLGWKVEEAEPDKDVAAGTRTAHFLVPLDAGETKVVTVPVRLTEGVQPESQFEFQLGYCITYDGRFCPGADPESVVPPPSVEWVPPLSLTVRYRDLGDAPDSTSHHATSMPAYGGVQANFPTVFDPNTGPDQGPAHLNPRPFHLGRRVSPEAEADVGPDLDPTNNLLPLLNIPNRDRRDDGLALKLLNFSPCQRSRVPVRVAVAPAAVAYFRNAGTTGYLNLWLDGNHDGDWADSFSCPEAQRAFEHIVIDHPINVVALGAGVHTLAVPTGLVPWSGQGAWLRATLSDRPSNKPLNAGGVDYGDGRGYAVPFLLGETEDYFLRPAGTEGAGPDVALDLDSGWRQRLPRGEGDLSPASPNLEILQTVSYFKASYRNEGSETAKDVVLTYYLAPALQDLDYRILSVPVLGDGVVLKQPGRIRIQLGDLDPGSEGTILASTCCYCLTCTLNFDLAQVTGPITGSATISSSNDVNPANNQDDTSVDLPELLQGGFTSLSGSYLRSAGVTSHNDVVLRGRSTPNTLLKIVALGRDGARYVSAVLSDNGSGTFEQTVNLPNGLYSIFVGPDDSPTGADGGHGSAAPEAVSFIESLDKASTPLILKVLVNNRLPWNPSSLIFIDARGRVLQPQSLGFENQAGWYGHLKAGETYQMQFEYSGADPAPVIQAHFLGQTIALADPLGNGVYQGEFIAGNPAAAGAAQAEVGASAPFSLSITTGQLQTVFGGTIQAASEGRVYDAATGLPVQAQVALLEAIGGNPQAGFDTWLGAAYGQANPQATAAGGLYAFWPEVGTYHLVVSADGYQSHRSWDVESAGGPVNPDLPLVLNIAEEPDYVVEMGPDGFDPPLLRVPAGAIVQWSNTDVADHTSTSIDPLLPGPGLPGNGGWDSGRLSGGDTFRLVFSTEGTFTYTDHALPGHTAQIQVGGYRVYLPVVLRRP